MYGICHLLFSPFLKQEFAEELARSPKKVLIFSAIYTLCNTAFLLHHIEDSEGMFLLAIECLLCALRNNRKKITSMEILTIIKNEYASHPNDIKKNISSVIGVLNKQLAFDVIVPRYGETMMTPEMHRGWRGSKSALMWIWLHLMLAGENNRDKKSNCSSLYQSLLEKLDFFILCSMCFEGYRNKKIILQTFIKNNYPLDYILVLIHSSIEDTKNIPAIYNSPAAIALITFEYRQLKLRILGREEENFISPNETAWCQAIENDDVERKLVKSKENLTPDELCEFIRIYKNVFS